MKEELLRDILFSAKREQLDSYILNILFDKQSTVSDDGFNLFGVYPGYVYTNSDYSVIYNSLGEELITIEDGLVDEYSCDDYVNSDALRSTLADKLLQVFDQDMVVSLVNTEYVS